MEEGKTEQDGKTTFDNIAINESDQRRVSNILDAVVSDGRIAKVDDYYQLVNGLKSLKTQH